MKWLFGEVCVCVLACVFHLELGNHNNTVMSTVATASIGRVKNDTLEKSIERNFRARIEWTMHENHAKARNLVSRILWHTKTTKKKKKNEIEPQHRKRILFHSNVVVAEPHRTRSGYLWS